MRIHIETAQGDDSSYVAQEARDKTEDYQRRLEDFLHSLTENSLDSSGVDKAVEFFSELYKADDSFGAAGGFRHAYNGIVGTLFGRGQEAPRSYEEIKKAVQNAQRVSTGLDEIAEALNERACEGRVLQCFGKLRDHVSLETNQLAIMESTFEGLDNASRTLDEKVQKTENQHITILGIFAAVVIVFNGAVAFSTAAFASSTEALSVPGLILSLLAVGFVSLNGVAILLAYLWRVVLGRKERVSWGFWALVVGADVVIVIAAIYVVVAWYSPLYLAALASFGG